MQTIVIQTQSKIISSDSLTPVSAFLRLRDRHAQCILLESNENGDVQNSKSIIAAHPLISIKADTLNTATVFINKEETAYTKVNPKMLLQNLIQSVDTENKSLANAFYGYFSYDSIPFFESIALKNDKIDIPLLSYSLYAYVLVFDHFKDTLTIYCNNLSGTTFQLVDIEQVLKNYPNTNSFFESSGNYNSNFIDADFLSAINRGIQHCLVGDVFQIVLSRRFSTPFIGDEFEVYRALRNINPSPYLFYFDFGDFKLFGSSPESLVKITKDKAILNPIAGTYKKTGDAAIDYNNIAALQLDVKENAEHVMLVDLARNDLSKVGENTNVTKYKEVHQYSHLIHLVSEVETTITNDMNCIDIFGAVFPAGTLSGAPKYKAMQLIADLEPTPRSFYGGAIGLIGLDNTMNQAIMIRTLLSKNYRLHLQAGAGIVAQSVPEKELEEVNTKLGALKLAIEKASKKVLKKIMQ